MLFRKNVARFCAYCVHAGKVNEEQVLCPKKGFVSAQDSCPRFRYDPLKRTPPRFSSKDFSKYDTDDFSL